VSECVCLDVNQGGTNRNHCTETCNLACTDLLMNTDRKPKTRSVWPSLQVKIARRKMWASSSQQSFTVRGMLVSLSIASNM